MSKRSTLLPLGITAFLGLLGAFAHAEGTVQIAMAGLYEYEWQIKPGGDWWGIFPDGKDGYSLQPTRVSAVPDPDMVVAPQKAPRQIRVPGENQGVIVFRGLMAAAAGPLKSVKLDKYLGPLPAGRTFDLGWDGDTPASRLQLVATGRTEPNQPEDAPVKQVADYELWLQRGSGDGVIRQLLFKESEGVGGHNAYLRWAGDLDRDGKLDLIYNLGKHHTQALLTLYLSSAAKPGELVGLVAQWDGYCGC